MDISDKIPGIKKHIGDRDVFIPEWTMQQHIAKTKYVMPLVGGPMANAAAMASEEDDDDSGSLYLAAVIRGVTDALATQDLSITIPELLDGVVFLNDNGVPVQASIKRLEEAGMTYKDVLMICVSVIKVNVGPLFDGDLQGNLMGL